MFDLLGFGTGTNNANNQVLDSLGNLIYINFGISTFCVPYQAIDIVCSQLTANQGLKDSSTQDSVKTALARLYLCDGNINSLSQQTQIFVLQGVRLVSSIKSIAHLRSFSGFQIRM